MQAQLFARPLLMGVLNVTPDSFSDGGRFLSADRALEAARRLRADGADWIDIGGESTRPGHAPVSAEEELARVTPVVRAAVAAGILVSIDTTKAAVARACLTLGAGMVNDQWGFQRDPEMAPLVAERGVDVVLMHNRESVDPALDIAEDLDRFFDRSLQIARRAGVREERIILDPGFGFGKTPEQNLAALRAIPRLKARGLRVLAGASRKSTLGRITGREVGDRLAATLGAHLFAAAAGADIIRAHDVAEHRDALLVWAACADAH